MKKLIAATTLICLNACVSYAPDKLEPHAYSGPHRPTAELATIHADLDDPSLIAVLMRIDDMKITNGGMGASKAFVLPGKHSVYVFGLNGSAYVPTAPIAAEFQAGHNYYLRHQITKDPSSGKLMAQMWFDDVATDKTKPSRL